VKVIRHILDQLGRQGGRAESVASVGWTCTYIPIEIVEAAGLTPARILPEPSSEKADAYLDPNFCPYVRACLGKAMDGEYKGLSGIIVANTCDGMRRLYDAWCHYMPPGFAFILDVPRTRSPNAIAYFRGRLQAFVRALEEYFKAEITEDSLRQATEEINRTRRLYQRLIMNHIQGVPGLRYSALLALFSKEWEGPRRLFNDALEEIVRITGQCTQKELFSPRVLVTGSILDGTSIIELIEELGGTIVGVDCCLAERMVQEVPLDGDILNALSESYLGKIPCARMKDTATRAKFLLRQVEKTRAQGLIYGALKFCDPYLYEFPALKEKLQKRDVPILFLEGEYRGRLGGGIRTRVQAFLEMLANFG